MGYWEDRVGRSTLQAHRSQQMALIYAVMICVFIILFLQFLMLTVALESYLGGQGGVILPTAVTSGICCALACKLIGYVLTQR
ncbi:MAG: hypothetical protein L0312_25015 [Acidobacteria bacterium]|nr:hypothetical protein [Acidobacteriota bacterium]